MKEEIEDSFLNTIANYALIIRTDLTTITEIKKQILLCPNVEVIYQKYSLKKLVITEEDGTDDNKWISKSLYK